MTTRVSTRIVIRLALRLGRALVPVILFIIVGLFVFGLLVFGLFVIGFVFPTLHALVVLVRSGHAGELDLLLENPAVLVHHRVVGRQEGDCDEGGRGIVETGRWRGSARTGWMIRRAGPRRARGGRKGTNARDARLSHTASADSYCAARTMSISSRFMSTTSRAESVATAGAAPGALAVAIVPRRPSVTARMETRVDARASCGRV